MKIAIVAYYFYPNNSIGSVRPEFWANWLTKNHKVSVITNNSGNYDDTKFSFQVIRCGSFMLNYFNKLKSKKNNLISSSSSNKSGFLTYRMPCLHDLWILPSFFKLIKYKPDLVIATHNPYANHLSSFIYCKLFNKKLIVDYRDLWTNSPFYSGVSGFKIIEKIIEKLILKNSIYITTVSYGLKNKLQTNVTGIENKIHVIYNTSFYRNILNKNDFDTKNIIFSYTGTIYKGWRDPTPFLQFIKKLKDCKLINIDNCKVIFASQSPGDFLDLAKSNDVIEFIDFRGSVTRNESFTIQDESDILILFEASNKNQEGVLTGKVFEYLATNKPILLIGPDKDSELFQLVNKYNRLISLNQIFDFYNYGTSLPKMCEININHLSETNLNKLINNV